MGLFGTVQYFLEVDRHVQIVVLFSLYGDTEAGNCEGGAVVFVNEQKDIL